MAYVSQMTQDLVFSQEAITSLGMVNDNDNSAASAFCMFTPPLYPRGPGPGLHGGTDAGPEGLLAEAGWGGRAAKPSGVPVRQPGVGDGQGCPSLQVVAMRYPCNLSVV